MRAETLRRHIDLHAWVGIVSGLALFVAFFAGAINMFHHEIGHWQEPHNGAVTDVDRNMQTLVDNFVAVHPQDAARTFYAIPGDQPSLMWFDQGAGAWRTSYADDFTADGTERDRPHSRLAGFINELHYRLSLPVVGLYLMGIVSVLYGAALISGLIIHWPKLTRELFALRHQGNLRRYWKNVHNLVGVASFPFHLIFAITGAAMCCFALLSLVLGTLVFGPQMQGVVTKATEAWPAPTASGESAAMAGVDRYLTAAKEQVPGLELQWIGLEQYGDKNAVVDVAGVVPGVIAHHAHVILRGDSAGLLTITGPGQRSFNHAILSPVYSLHFGDYGGALVRILYFILGLLGALLFFSGNILWCERRTDRHGPSLSAAVLLRLTLGVTLGCVAGIAMSFMASKAAIHSPWASSVTLAEKGAFLATLAAALVTAFRLPPLDHARFWLRLGVFLYLAVPMVQGLTEGAGSWRDPGVLVVNAAMVSVAISLALVEILRVRRRRQAGTHPLWELPVSRRPASGVHL